MRRLPGRIPPHDHRGGAAGRLRAPCPRRAAGIPRNVDAFRAFHSATMIRIPLTQGKFALIDDEDLELVSRYTWCANKKQELWYAVTTLKKPNRKFSTVNMGRVILG